MSVLGSSHIIDIQISCQRCRIDWPSIMADLKAAGMSYQAQALVLDKRLSTIQRWLHDGVEPRYSDGADLIRMHAEVCGVYTTLERLKK